MPGDLPLGQPGPHAHAFDGRRVGAWLALCMLATPCLAQDAARGAMLYMQLPNGLASCVSCHGPEPQGNRNSLLKAADNPQALTKALATVGAMSHLRAGLDEGGVQDIAAFLGGANRAAASSAALVFWPLTADFGTLGLGAAAGPQQVQLLNRGGTGLRLNPPALHGQGFALQHDCPALLAAGARCTVRVTALALAPGWQGGAVVLGSPDWPGAGAVALAAHVQVAAAGVLQWQGGAADGLLDLGALPAGQQRSVQRRLVNAGPGALTLGAPPAVAGSLSLTGDNLAPVTTSGCAAGTVLAPTEACTLGIRLEGGSAVPVQALLQVRSSGQNPPALALSAGAVPPPASAPPAPLAPPGHHPDSPAGGLPDKAPEAPVAGGGALGPLAWLALWLACRGLRPAGPGLPRVRLAARWRGRP